MADTVTTKHGFVKPEVNASDDTWGAKLNADWDSLDAILNKAATNAETLTGTATDRSLTPDNLAALWELGVDVASAANVTLGDGGFFNITGNAVITDIDWTTPKDGRGAWLRFTGAATLTNSATLILPGGANIVTVAGDTGYFAQLSGDTVICTIFSRVAAAPVYVSSPTGRLTLTSGVPVLTADVINAGTIYWTPFGGNTYSWFNGTIWTTRTTAELTLTLNATAHLIGKNYDLFLFNDAGTDRLVAGPAWTSDTVRSAAIVRHAVGLYVNSALMAATYGASSVNVPANQGIYVGTFRASANGQTQMKFGSATTSNADAYLFLWNRFNQVDLLASMSDGNGPHTMTGATIREWGSAGTTTTMRANFVRGLAESPAKYEALMRFTSAAAGAFMQVGVQIDGTSSFGSAARPMGNLNFTVSAYAMMLDNTSIGFHFFTALESSDGSNANTISTNGAAGNINFTMKG